MEDTPKPPLVFANRVIRQLVDHALGDDCVLLPKDYMLIRTAFRWYKGSWEMLFQGDMAHNRLLANIIANWGKLPERQRRTDVEIV